MYIVNEGSYCGKKEKDGQFFFQNTQISSYHQVLLYGFIMLLKDFSFVNQGNLVGVRAYLL